jgi:hypothetical protein
MNYTQSNPPTDNYWRLKSKNSCSNPAQMTKLRSATNFLEVMATQKPIQSPYTNPVEKRAKKTKVNIDIASRTSESDIIVKSGNLCDEY